MPDMWMDVDVALAEVPVNVMPLIDDTDFVSRETAIAHNAAGMDLVWNFVTTGGAFTQTAVTPTTAGDYDWTNQGDGMYTIEIPASGGASINNNTEGFGWFSGLVTGVLPWRGPVIGFRAAALNNALIDGGDSLDVNVTQVSGDSAAADNLEADYDGTGYAKTNSTIGTCTTNTDMRGTNSAATAAALTTVEGKIDTIDSIVDAILIDTGTDIPATLVTIDTVVDAIQAVTDQLVAAQNEPSSVPSANATPLIKLAYLYMALRNKVTVTAGQKSFFSDSNSLVWEKDLSDDGTTYTEDEAAAGA